jgi:4-amino-4-deoxy-L-arabinose transferase-like glycosyltransferase
MLSVMMAVIAAVAVARIVTHLSDRRAGAIAGGLYLVTPWTLATGTIAFDEQAMMALGAAALLVVIRSGEPAKPGEAEGLDGWRCGLITGLLCGAATLVKLSAAGMIALPIGALLLMRRSTWTGKGIGRVAAFALTTAAVIGLWMARNEAWCGQPTFPMFTNLFGTAHWTAEQARRFTEAMRPDGGIAKGLGELWSSSRGLWDPWFGFVVWPLAAIGAAAVLVSPKLRWAAAGMVVMIGVQVGFWVGLTHWQSRFLIPLLVPACVLIGLGMAEVSQRGRWAGRVAMGLAVAAVLWCTGVGFAAYFSQPGAPLLIDGVERMVGDVEPARTLNRLPPASRVYAEAWATPLYVQTPLAYHTVWDASPLGAAMSKGGATGALRWLRREGFTHVVIDWSMLRLWTGPNNYGYDPRVSPSGLAEMAQAVLQPVAGWGGVMLLRVPWGGGGVTSGSSGGVDPVSPRP